MIGTHFHHSAIYARALLQTPRLRAPRQGKTEEVRQRFHGSDSAPVSCSAPDSAPVSHAVSCSAPVWAWVLRRASHRPRRAWPTAVHAAPRTWPRARPPRPAAPPPVPPAAPPPAAPPYRSGKSAGSKFSNNYSGLSATAYVCCMYCNQVFRFPSLYDPPSLARLCSKPTGGMESDFQERRKPRGGRG